MFGSSYSDALWFKDNFGGIFTVTFNKKESVEFNFFKDLFLFITF